MSNGEKRNLIVKENWFLSWENIKAGWEQLPRYYSFWLSFRQFRWILHISHLRERTHVTSVSDYNDYESFSMLKGNLWSVTLWSPVIPNSWYVGIVDFVKMNNCVVYFVLTFMYFYFMYMGVLRHVCLYTNTCAISAEAIRGCQIPEPPCRC